MKIPNGTAEPLAWVTDLLQTLVDDQQNETSYGSGADPLAISNFPQPSEYPTQLDYMTFGALQCEQNFTEQGYWSGGNDALLSRTEEYLPQVIGHFDEQDPAASYNPRGHGQLRSKRSTLVGPRSSKPAQ